jgi:hypothetical protein
LADNNIGEIVPPDGWTKRRPKSHEEMSAYGEKMFVHTDGTKQKEVPSGSKPEGVIAVANAIRDNGSLASLNLAANLIGGYWVVGRHGSAQMVATPEGTLCQYI